MSHFSRFLYLIIAMMTFPIYATDFNDQGLCPGMRYLQKLNEQARDYAANKNNIEYEKIAGEIAACISGKYGFSGTATPAEADIYGGIILSLTLTDSLLKVSREFKLQGSGQHHKGAAEHIQAIQSRVVAARQVSAESVSPHINSGAAENSIRTAYQNRYRIYLSQQRFEKMLQDLRNFWRDDDSSRGLIPYGERSLMPASRREQQVIHQVPYSGGMSALNVVTPGGGSLRFASTNPNPSIEQYSMTDIHGNNMTYTNINNGGVQMFPNGSLAVNGLRPDETLLFQSGGLTLNIGPGNTINPGNQVFPALPW